MIVAYDMLESLGRCVRIPAVRGLTTVLWLTWEGVWAGEGVPGFSPTWGGG